MTDWLKLGSSILNVAAPLAQGSQAKTAGKYQAQQYYNNARLRARAGQEESWAWQAAGRKAVSDATTAMVSQGGTVDSAMLAKMKKESEIDALSALYEAKADAQQMSHAGRMAQMQGNAAYRAGVVGATSNLLKSASSFKWKGFGGPGYKGSRAKDYNSNAFDQWVFNQGRK